MRSLLVRSVIGVVGVIFCSSTANAHEFGHGATGHGAASAFAVVLALPVLAGLAGGAAAFRYRRFRSSETGSRESSIAVGLLLVGLGVASLLSAVVGHLWLSVAGAAVGAAIALQTVSSRTDSGTRCGNHVDLTLGTISAHRLLEGIVLGTLYSTGAAVGLFGAVVLAGHTALETAAVGGLYGAIPHRIRVIGAIVFVQAGYVAGAIAGFVVADAVPVSVRTLALAAVGGVLLVVGVDETERSILAGEPTVAS